MSILSFENDNLPHPALYRLWHSYISHFILFRRANTIGARLKEHSVLKLKLDGHNLPSHRVSRFSDFFQIICSILEGPITCILPIEYFRFHICSIDSFCIDTANVCDNIANLRLILGCILYRTTMTLLAFVQITHAQSDKYLTPIWMGRENMYNLQWGTKKMSHRRPKRWKKMDYWKTFRMVRF